MNKNLLFYILICANQLLYSSESSQCINKWYDIGPFAGKMVVFQSIKCCLNSKYCYRIGAQQNIRVALIGNKPVKNFDDGMGYPISRLLTINAPLRDTNLILTDHELENIDLTMREPDIHESCEIQAAVKNKKAKFEHLKLPSCL